MDSTIVALRPSGLDKQANHLLLEIQVISSVGSRSPLLI
jgi:hypothetical protein